MRDHRFETGWGETRGRGWGWGWGRAGLPTISAEGIPKGFMKEVYCQYTFKESSRQAISTEARSGTTEPNWGHAWGDG